MSGEDALREALAAAVLADSGLHLDYDRGYVDPQEIADALLPVVLRYGREKAAAVLRSAAQEQRNEAENVPDTDKGTHADGHRCAAEFIDRRADALTAQDPT